MDPATILAIAQIAVKLAEMGAGLFEEVKKVATSSGVNIDWAAIDAQVAAQATRLHDAIAAAEQPPTA